MAHTLTALRFLLIVPIGLLLASERGWAPIPAAAILVVGIVTDLLDGPMARRSGTATALGGAFDHGTDCLFVVSGLAGGAVRGVFPWILPALVLLAFAEYVADSIWLYGERRLRASQLGRYNGILYFAPLCGDTLVRVGLAPLRPAVTALCWLLVVTTCLSIGQRLWPLTRARRRAPASRDAGTAGRSRH